jgi:hypothetical protein
MKDETQKYFWQTSCSWRDDIAIYIPQQSITLDGTSSHSSKAALFELLAPNQRNPIPNAYQPGECVCLNSCKKEYMNLN